MSDAPTIASGSSKPYIAAPASFASTTLAFGVDEDAFERRGGERAKSLLAAELVGDLALRDVGDERDRERSVCDEHARERDLERKLRSVLAKAARLVALRRRRCPDARALGNELTYARSLGVRDLIEDRFTAKLLRVFVSEELHVRGIRVQHDAIARKRDREGRLVEERLKPGGLFRCARHFFDWLYSKNRPRSRSQYGRARACVS